MFGRKAGLLIWLFFGWHSMAWSQAPTDIQGAPIEPQETNAYYTIQDESRTQKFIPPTDLLAEGFEVLAAKAAQFSLLKWVRHEGLAPVSPEPYNRRRHFGPWINDPNDETCHNTRAKVLIRDSLEPVTFRETNHCIVDTGHWEDPYSGVIRTSARDIQIDHVVPLKNAFVSGAWTWNTQKRCLYGNFMENNFHLISVDGHENMAKGDSAPDQYLPPQRKYICQYLQEWLKIKMIWKLQMTQSEANTIRDTVNEYGCSPKDLSISEIDLSKQRVASDGAAEACIKLALRLDKAALKQNAKEASSQVASTP